MATKTPEQKAFDVRLSAEKREAFGHWLCEAIQNALDQRAVPVPEVRYWWTLYEQGRTRTQTSPWQDAADLTSYLGTEKVDALRARIMRTIFVDPMYTVEGWGQSAGKAPFVEDFHQWAAESEGLQAFLGRGIHQSLIEPRGVIEVFEDTTERVTRKTIRAQVVTNPMDGSWVMDGESMEPQLLKDEQGNYVEALDPMIPSAEVTIDERQRVRKGPGYRVLAYEHFLVLPAHAREKADIWGYAKYVTKRWDELQDLAKAGVYEKAAVEAIHPDNEVVSALSPSGEAIPVPPQDGAKAEKELWEAQILTDLDGKGLRWYVVTVHLRNQTILRLKHDNINKGRFIILVPFPRTDRSHEGYSFLGHKLITCVEEHTAWRNMIADRAALVISAPMKRLTTALWDPDLQPMGPRAVIDVRDHNEIMPMDVPDLTQPAMNREQEIVSASERVAGINDVALGRSPDHSQTLGEVNLVAEQSFVRMDEVIKNLQEPLEELGQIRNAIWVEALKDTERYGGTYAPQYLFEGLDERGGDPCKDGKVTPDLLEGTFRFKPRGSTENADLSKQRGDYIQFLQAIPMLMHMWPALAMQLGQNMEAAKSALEQALRLFRIPDKQAWLAPPPMMPMQIDPMTGQPMMQPPGMGMNAPGMGMPPGAPPGMPPGMPPAPMGAPPQPPQGV